MFQELMPLLAHRVVVLTATRTGPDLICVNVIPQRLKSGDENNDALTTPLSLTGTPRELDEELPKQLVEFVHSHLELSSTPSSPVHPGFFAWILNSSPVEQGKPYVPRTDAHLRRWHSTPTRHLHPSCQD